MMIFKNELRKIWRKRIVWGALLAALILNIALLLFSSGYPMSLQNPYLFSYLSDIKSFRHQLSGPITETWVAQRQTEIDTILSETKYRVSAEEEANITQSLTEQGFSAEEIAQMPYVFLNDAGQLAYDRYEDISFASNFRNLGVETRDKIMTLYQNRYPGEIGEKFASKTDSDYHALLFEYTPYYDYQYGYLSMQKILTFYPYIIGIVVLIALSPLFSSEYSGRTDSLLLTSRYGRRKLALGKISAGLVSSIFIWASITTINLVLSFSIYGTEGWDSFWQDWIHVIAPFTWNQGQALLIALATSLMGTLCYGCVLMLLSSKCQSAFTSILLGAALLLVPMFEPVRQLPLLGPLCHYFPSFMIVGQNLWGNYSLLNLFGHPVMYQYTVLAVIFGGAIVSVLYAVRSFCTHQIKA